MEATMDDQSILHRIQHLVDEEHRLDDQKSRSPEDHEHHRAIQVELDQCWDLLRQRRALREYGGDASQAQARPPEVVEKYIG
jgi:hypothetical protein